MDGELRQIMNSFRALACIDCGKCTALCPVSRHADFSPRLAISRMAGLGREEFLGSRDLWDCITCGACAEICPADVKYPHLTRLLREKSVSPSRMAPCSHAGALHSMMRMKLSAEEERTQVPWIGEGAGIAGKGDVLYFAGCGPQFDIYFEDLSPGLSGIALSSVRILNRLGVIPAVLPDEKCCGHDLLWSGDAAAFRALSAANAEAISRTGASTVVCSCAECWHTMKFDMPEAVGRLPFRVLHISEFMKEKGFAGLAFRKSGATAAYHDPCRLGRLGGVYSEPREALSKAADIREMEHSGRLALCCGTSSWVNCGAASMAIQKRRLCEAEAAGADVLVTACPKCKIHFLCAQKKNEGGGVPRIPVRDLAEILAESL